MQLTRQQWSALPATAVLLCFSLCGLVGLVLDQWATVDHTLFYAVSTEALSIAHPADVCMQTSMCEVVLSSVKVFVWIGLASAAISVANFSTMRIALIMSILCATCVCFALLCVGIWVSNTGAYHSVDDGHTFHTRVFLLFGPPSTYGVSFRLLQAASIGSCLCVVYLIAVQYYFRLKRGV